MNDVETKLKRIFLNAGFSNEEIKKVHDRKLKLNNHSEGIVSIIAIAYFLIAFFIGFFFIGYEFKQVIYIVEIFIIMEINILFGSNVEGSEKKQSILIIVFEVSLLLTGMLTALREVSENSTLVFMVLNILVPIIFITPPIQETIMVLFFDILYLVLIYKLKARDFFIPEIINICIYGSLGIIFGFYTKRIKYMCLLKEEGK